MRVLLVTTWDAACGISEHSRMLKAAVEAVDPGIEIVPLPECLDPNAFYDRSTGLFRFHASPEQMVLHLNYQASLHSRWTAGDGRDDKVNNCGAISYWRARGWKVVVTYHDTGVPNSEQCKAIVGAADAAVVHEPYDDLPPETHYWRMGVPRWRPPTVRNEYWTEGRPVLGTVGFPFPWKCYDQLAEVTAKAGWAFLVIAPTATDEQIERWKAINPRLLGYKGFIDQETVLSELGSCDATAFTYVCHNTGQSGAILQGIAARKPVIALSTCRQFRALYTDPLGEETIRWCETFEEVGWMLRRLPIQRVDPGIVALAEQESWIHLGKKYARLYRSLL